MTAGTVAREREVVYFEAELLLCLRDNPHIRLVAVVLRGWVRMRWRQSVINAEDWNLQALRPLPSVALVSS